MDDSGKDVGKGWRLSRLILTYCETLFKVEFVDVEGTGKYTP